MGSQRQDEQQDDNAMGAPGGGERGFSAAEEGAGPTAHTTPREGHPAGTGARSARDVGGPVREEDAPESGGSGHGTPPPDARGSHGAEVEGA